MYQIDYTNVGKRMKTLRKQAGYTQEQIADALDVTVAFISNIENDRVKMNLRVLSYYAKLLNVSIDYLLTGKEKESKSTVILSDIEEKLINDFRNLSPQGQDYIRQQMFMAREVYKKQDLPQADLNAG